VSDAWLLAHTGIAIVAIVLLITWLKTPPIFSLLIGATYLGLQLLLDVPALLGLSTPGTFKTHTVAMSLASVISLPISCCWTSSSDHIPTTADRWRRHSP
jgi:hypothetical protein